MNRTLPATIKLHARTFDLLSAACALLFSRRRSLAAAALLAFALGPIVQSPATAQTRYHFDVVPVPDNELSFGYYGLTNDGVILSELNPQQAGLLTEKNGSQTLILVPGSIVSVAPLVTYT